jgi:hypothetical protein
MIRELYNVSRMSGAYALVEEGAERRLGKMMQILIAQKYFKIPEWHLVLGQNFAAPENTIVKSLSGESIDDNNVLYTTNVSGKLLDANYVWFNQNLIAKRSDITVCFVNDKTFAFELIASNQDDDWRTTLDNLETQNWQPTEISDLLIEQIRIFMHECGLRFGRIDFVSDGKDVWFLEVNPNGQWAWLDLEDKNGLITHMIKSIQGLN